MYFREAFALEQRCNRVLRVIHKSKKLGIAYMLIVRTGKSVCVQPRGLLHSEECERALATCKTGCLLEKLLTAKANQRGLYIHHGAIL